MRWHISSAVLCLLATVLFTAPVAAAPPVDEAPAVAGELPAALRAIDVRPEQLLTRTQAKAVRGQWVATINLPYVATQIQGTRPFTLQVWTIGAGIAPGTPVYIRLSIH